MLLLLFFILTEQREVTWFLTLHLKKTVFLFFLIKANCYVKNVWFVPDPNKMDWMQEGVKSPENLQQAFKVRCN